MRSADSVLKSGRMAALSLNGGPTAISISLGALIILSVALPSGTLFGLPIKHLAYLATVFSIMHLWASRKICIPQVLVFGFVSLSVVTAFFVLVGALKGATEFGFVLKEAVGVFTAVSVVFLVLACTESGAVSRVSVVSFAFYGALLFASWKVLLVLGLVTRAIDYSTAYAFVLEQAGYRLVSSGIFGGLVRINLIIYDFLVAFILTFLIVSPGMFSGVGKLARAAFFLIGTACLVFAFSRLLFGMVALGWCVAFLFRFRLRAKVFAVLTAVMVGLVAAPWIEGAYQQRFRSAGTSESDEIRTEQIVALVDEWARSPIIGGGFGNYSRDLVRDRSAPYNYEVQWVGFLAKLGVLGVGYLLVLVTMLYWGVYAGAVGVERIMLFFTLSTFILGGLTNQYLVTSASGVIYSLHLMLAAVSRQTDSNPS